MFYNFLSMILISYWRKMRFVIIILTKTTLKVWFQPPLSLFIYVLSYHFSFYLTAGNTDNIGPPSSSFKPIGSQEFHIGPLTHWSQLIMYYDYSTTAFFQSFVIFSTRHGFPSIVFCDEGSQLVKSTKERHPAELQWRSLDYKVKGISMETYPVEIL